MTAFRIAYNIFHDWMDRVTATVIALNDWFSKPRIVKLVEREPGKFGLVEKESGNSENTGAGLTHETNAALQNISDSQFGDPGSDFAKLLSGCRVELFLHPDRFLFRPLDLPSPAVAFLDGIVRAQIDRLTPWNSADAAFGWSKPAPSGSDRITVTVVATALARIRSHLQGLANLGAHSVAVFTSFAAGTDNEGSVKVWEERGPGALDVGRVQHALVAILGAVGIAAILSVMAAGSIGASLESEQGALTRQIAHLRATGGGETDAQRILARRKHDIPATVMVIDTLAQILPDHTYVTELRLEANKLRVIGITRDAPSLIGLMEQSGRFSSATFFAPTTRSPADPGERFHIEATIQPLRSARS